MPPGFGPLAGLRVIELCHVMAGPTCGLMLADMGADVIKVEKADGGDDTRRSLPPDVNGEAAAFLMMNRNKRGIVVDLKTEGGRGVLRRLLKDADVVTENYRRGTMARLGLDYESLRKDNPGLIFLNVKEMHANEQVRARDMVVATDHPVAGRVETLGLPLKFADTPGRVARPAPTFGQHTAEVLREVGYAPAEIEALAQTGAVVLGDPARADAAD